VQTYVGSYATTDSASPQPSGPSEAPADATSAATALDEALEEARRQLERGCAQEDFLAQLTTALGGVVADGAVAEAVLARLTANLTGTTGTERTVQVAAGDDLAAVTATAAPGATLYLAEGRYRLPDTLVLLDGVTLVGVDRDATTLVSGAPDAAVLVLSPDLVGFRDLTITRDEETSGTVLVAGAATTISIERSTLSGGRADPDSRGGAGIDLAGADTGTSPGRTTVELTDVVLQDNAWAGLAVGGGHRVSVVDSTFRRNGECGACFLGVGEGSIERSTFVGNRIGVAVVDEATPVLTGNRIRGGSVGIQVAGKATPTITDNRLAGTGKAALIYTETAAGVLRGTTCTGVEVGIVLSAKALPSLHDNDCTLARASK